ncbi:MAG: hypothetical protein ABWZ52_02045 [Acidimicrobiales bacterium]
MRALVFVAAVAVGFAPVLLVALVAVDPAFGAVCMGVDVAIGLAGFAALHRHRTAELAA